MTTGGSLLEPPAAVPADTETRRRVATSALRVLALVAVLASAYVALRYVEQPILEAHAFRQTHTALTAYWLQRNGFSFAYETPVAGAPWAIPFEAPLYESVVAAAASLTGAPLQATGRVVSWVAFLASIFPVLAIGKRLKLDRATVLAFVALWMSSPLYLFWGRSFLIETTVVFLVLAGLPFGIDVVRGVADPRRAAVAGLVFSLAMLQKPTAAAPVLLVVGLSWLFSEIRRFRAGAALDARTVSSPLLCFAPPLIAAFAWTSFADGLKKLNAFGSQITSQSLHAWHFGTLSQRVSAPLFVEVYWRRLIHDNAGGILGTLVIIAAFVFGPPGNAKKAMALCLVLFVLPPLMFANLHIVHTYYQVECGLFGAAALAIAVCLLAGSLTGHPLIVPVLTAIFVALNLSNFRSAHAAELTARFSPSNNRTLALAEVLKRHTPRDSGFVAFGYDWSSELAFFAERRSFTVPEWFSQRRLSWEEPQHFLGTTRLGAIVICPSQAAPSRDDVLRRYWSERRWSYLEHQGCQVLFPKEP